MRALKLLAAALVVVTLVPVALVHAEETSGPAKGSAPMLTIKPINRDGDAYCLTCDGGLHPLVVALLRRSDEATQKLLTQLAAQAKASADKQLHATIVI